MEKKFTVNEIENEIIRETAHMRELESKDTDKYEMAIIASGENELYMEELLREYYPRAFDRDFIDEELYNELTFILDREHNLSLEMILNATKISDKDRIYTCKVRSFHNGKFVNNYIHIYLDGKYIVKEKKQLDAELTCSAICCAIGHEFVAVLDIKEVK